MANNKIQVKRTNVAGRTPNTSDPANTQYISAGELALNMTDGLLFTSNGSALIEVGANNTIQTVTTNNLTVGNTLYVVANGNVGIGTNAPSQKMVVEGITKTTTLELPRNDDAEAVRMTFNSALQGLSLGSRSTELYTYVVSGGGAGAFGLSGTAGLISFGGSYPGSPSSTVVRRDSDHVVAQRNGANSQTSRIYGTYTDASNYERLSLSANGTGAYVLAEEAGTGIARDLFIGANNSTKMVVAANGNIGIGNSTPTGAFVINQGNITNKRSLIINNLGAGTTGVSIGALSIGDNSGLELQYDTANYRLAYRVRGNIGGNSSLAAHAFSIDSTAAGTFGEVFRIKSGAAGPKLINMVQTDNTSSFSVKYNGDAYILGNTGIGNSSPAHKLRVEGDISLSGGVHANGGFGTSGQVLTSNGTVAYWSTPTTGTVTSVGSGNGLTGGPITTSGSLSVLANTGIVANVTGVFVNSAYIATLAANSATFLNGNTASDLRSYSDSTATTAYSNAVSAAASDASNKAANAYTNAVAYVDGKSFVNTSQLSSNLALYQTTAGLSANVATLTSNNSTFSYGKTEGALNVNNALTANNANNLGGVAASGYQTTAGLSANVATLTANNTSFVGTVSAANVVSNAQLSANLTNYQTTAGLSANVATLTSNNSTFSYGKTEGALNVNSATTSLTANNATNLGGIVAANYVQNTDSRTLSGNLVFSGANVAFTGNLRVTGGLLANGSLGASNQVLSTNGSSVYWANGGSSGGGVYLKGGTATIGTLATEGQNIFRVNANTLNNNTTIVAGENAQATGPIDVVSGVTLTIELGARVSIV